ncbi:MAG: hypothetical protein GY809_31570, partial [Planctomycetes bacterium]|nr:hypothetical protein [Planctomycetota bacterium]
VDNSFSLEHWLPVLVVIAQIVTIAAVFGLIAEKRRLVVNHKQGMARLSTRNDELSRQINELTEQMKAVAREEQTASQEPETSELPEESEQPVTVH